MITKRKQYIPTNEELYLIQEYGGNVYKYLICKTIEKIIIEGLNNPNIGMLKQCDNSFKEDYNIALSVCEMYPEEIKYSKIMQYEPSLCLKLISEQPKINNSLDNLKYFSQSVLNNTIIINEVITKLSKILLDNPKYRFTYKNNKLLDNIFLCNLDLSDLYSDRDKLILSIEPAYSVKYQDYYQKNYLDFNKIIKTAIDTYGLKFSLPLEFGLEYQNKDIITKQPQKVKKLIKYINNEL